jgi:hypothetical protein
MAAFTRQHAILTMLYEKQDDSSDSCEGEKDPKQL